jgi:hypothetical protein
MKPFKQIILGLVLVASALFLQAAPIAAAFTQQTINSGLCAGSSGEVSDSAAAANCNSSDATDKINNLIQTIVNLLSAIVGFVAVVMIIVGGLRYITSGGNDTSVTGAKNTILYAIIGLIIVALSQLIVHFVLNKVTNS